MLKELKADPAVQYAEADVKLRRTELRAGDVQPAELQRVLKELKADPAVQYAEADVKLRRTELRAGDVQPA
ncbi:hypothetical protein C7E18_24335, partial [Stenotrophomonas maltophilia]